ncbi:MAG TPA: Ig-like domain-containing protein, partial [Verrucomicrobiae bacterium]|nr:Ig-like domain-containing protein [Verrucomicrobiae bacterium]
MITVQGNQPPTVQFARVTPVTGAVASGSMVVVDVTAADDSGVAELRAIVAGIGSSGLITTNGGQLRVQGQVSAAAGPDSQVEIFAEAFDELGLSSGQQAFLLPISDGTTPTLAINSPAANTLVNRGELVPVTLQLNDNFGVSEVRLNISGAFTAEVISQLSPIITNGLTVVNFTVPADAPTAGGVVNLSITAHDAAGNASTAAASTLRLPDTTPPALVSISPPDGASGVDPQAVIRLNFSEALDPATVIAENFTLVPSVGGGPVPLNFALEDADRRVVLTVSEQLALDAEYRLTVAAAVADAGGNPLGNEFTSTFRTGDFRLVSPTQGQSVVEGQALGLEASSPTATYPLVRFLAAGEEVGRDASAPYQV